MDGSRWIGGDQTLRSRGTSGEFITPSHTPPCYLARSRRQPGARKYPQVRTERALRRDLPFLSVEWERVRAIEVFPFCTLFSPMATSPEQSLGSISRGSLTAMALAGP